MPTAICISRRDQARSVATRTPPRQEFPEVDRTVVVLVDDAKSAQNVRVTHAPPHRRNQTSKLGEIDPAVGISVAVAKRLVQFEMRFTRSAADGFLP